MPDDPRTDNRKQTPPQTDGPDKPAGPVAGVPHEDKETPPEDQKPQEPQTDET